MNINNTNWKIFRKRTKKWIGNLLRNSKYIDIDNILRKMARWEREDQERRS